MPPSSRRTKRRKSLLLLLSSKWRAWHRTLRPACARQTTSERSPRTSRQAFLSILVAACTSDVALRILPEYPVPIPAGRQGVSPANVLGGGAPARKRWGGTGVLQRQRPPPAAETGSCCWGRGQQDASDSEADAGCRNPSLFAEKAPCWLANYYRRNCELPTHSF